MGIGMARKLVAIVAADVVGFSRLIVADEAGTLAALKTHRQELIASKIAERQGRIVKTTGDCLQIELQSVVEAVQCAQSRSTARCRAAYRRAGRPSHRVPGGSKDGAILFTES